MNCWCKGMYKSLNAKSIGWFFSQVQLIQNDSKDVFTDGMGAFTFSGSRLLVVPVG